MITFSKNRINNNQIQFLRRSGYMSFFRFHEISQKAYSEVLPLFNSPPTSLFPSSLSKFEWLNHKSSD